MARQRQVSMFNLVSGLMVGLGIMLIGMTPDLPPDRAGLETGPPVRIMSWVEETPSGCGSCHSPFLAVVK